MELDQAFAVKPPANFRLTDAQVVALEKAKTEKEAHGEFARANIRAIAAPRIPFMWAT